jgi:mitochondrial import inner membrane translocase subunit TIM17
MNHQGMESGREPCPYRIVDDVGSAFLIGAIGGSIWHGVKGAKNSPRGERFAGSLVAIKARAPVLGGQFSSWGGLFSCFDCSLVALRKKEDPFNSIAAGGITGALLSARAGASAAAKSGAIGAVLLALIEGLSVLIQRQFAPPPPSFSETGELEGGVAAPPMVLHEPTYMTAEREDAGYEHASDGGAFEAGDMSQGDVYTTETEIMKDKYASSVLESPAEHSIFLPSMFSSMGLPSVLSANGKGVAGVRGWRPHAFRRVNHGNQSFVTPMYPLGLNFSINGKR